jgi:putative transposon-encoded protein
MKSIKSFEQFLKKYNVSYIDFLKAVEITANMHKNGSSFKNSSKILHALVIDKHFRNLGQDLFANIFDRGIDWSRNKDIHSSSLNSKWLVLVNQESINKMLPIRKSDCKAFENIRLNFEKTVHEIEYSFVESLV